MSVKHSAKGLLDAVERHHFHGASSILREVTILDPEVMRMKAAYYRLRYPNGYYSTGAYSHYDIEGLTLEDIPEDIIGQSEFRRIDALMFGARNKSGAYQRTAIEVKISRADFKRDTDVKRRAWAGATHRFVYAVPKGLVTPDEVPAGCGLWEVEYTVGDNDSATYHGLEVTKRAVINRAPATLADETFVAYMAGRAYRAEYERRNDSDLQRALAELASTKSTVTWYRESSERHYAELTALRKRFGVAS